MRQLMNRIRFRKIDRKSRKSQEGGFTIVETSVAMVIMMVAALASASLFAYAIQNNAGANDRELAMAVAQQEMEKFRSVAFTSTDLTATAGATKSVVRAGRTYTVVTAITDSDVVNGAATIKTITISVTPTGTALGSVTLRARRSTILRGPNS